MDCFTQEMEMDFGDDTEHATACEEVTANLLGQFLEATELPPPPLGSSTVYGKANHTPLAATSEPPPKRTATQLLPPSECEPCEPMDTEPIASRLRQEPQPVADRFSESEHSAGSWSAYNLERSGSRHVQVHEQNRHELWEERNELWQELDELKSNMAARYSQIAEQLEGILHGLDDREVEAAEALQEAILQIFEDAEEGDGGVDDDGDDGRGDAEPDAADAEANVREADAGEASRVPPVLGVTRALYKQQVGGLVLSASTLAFVPPGVHVSAGDPRICLTNVVNVSAADGADGLPVLSVKAGRSGLTTYSFTCEFLTDAFVTQLRAAVAAAAKPAAGRTLTKRVQEGRKLRDVLLRHARLVHDHKAKQAAELLASLQGESSASDATTRAKADKREDNLAKKRAGELRDAAFSFGGYSLTRKIVGRFMAMPEVRLLLPDHLQSRRAVDEKTRDILLDTARVFLTELLGTKGRRSDEDANAWEAAAVSLIPKSLFSDKRGRSASRLTGLSYRQLKRACAGRGKMEDVAKGWVRRPPSRHADRIDYTQCRDFWHEHPKVTVPDNQNKQMVKVENVRVYGDFDESTGQQSYELHERRAQLCTDLAAVPIFRGSEYGARLRAEVKARARPGAAAFEGIVGRRQLVEQKCLSQAAKPRNHIRGTSRGVKALVLLASTI